VILFPATLFIALLADRARTRARAAEHLPHLYLELEPEEGWRGSISVTMYHRRDDRVESEVGHAAGCVVSVSSLSSRCLELVQKLAEEQGVELPDRVFSVHIRMIPGWDNMRLAQLMYQAIGSVAWFRHRSFIVSGNCTGATLARPGGIWKSLAQRYPGAFVDAPPVDEPGHYTKHAAVMITEDPVLEELMAIPQEVAPQGTASWRSTR